MKDSAGTETNGGIQGDAKVGNGLYVIGMHRSGTSAVTGLIIPLGIPGPPAEDRLSAGKWNERGNNESLSLNRFNEDLLRQAGGSWSAPPALPRLWESNPIWNDRRAEAGTLVTKVFGKRSFVWKDPRNSILLPFWRTVTAPPRAAVFVYRRPFEVAASIEARNGFVLTHSLALWERYVRSAAANLDGTRRFLSALTGCLMNRGHGARSLEFLRVVGLEVDDGLNQYFDQSLDATLRHHTTFDQPSSGIYESQRRVLDVLDGLGGSHFPWSAPDLGDEPEWVEDVFTMWRRYIAERRNHRRSSSPIARASDVVRRAGRQLRGGDPAGSRP